MTKAEILRAIRFHCLDCCCGSSDEVKLCGCQTCNLYPLRFGKDPTPRELSPAQLERLRKMAQAKKLKGENHDGE